MDLIDGRLDLRKLTQQDATLLQEWVSDSYVIIPRVVPEKLLAPAWRIWSGLTEVTARTYVMTFTASDVSFRGAGKFRQRA
jgi:hypothetical protein